MPIEQIIFSYGAIGVFVGTFFEGEAIVILADAKKYELAAAGLIIAAGWSVWAVRRFRQRRR
jgi:hypothetical protein